MLRRLTAAVTSAAALAASAASASAAAAVETGESSLVERRSWRREMGFHCCRAEAGERLKGSRPF